MCNYLCLAMREPPIKPDLILASRALSTTLGVHISANRAQAVIDTLLEQSYTHDHRLRCEVCSRSLIEPAQLDGDGDLVCDTHAGLDQWRWN